LQQGGRGGRGGRGRGDGRGHHQNKGEGSGKYHSNRQAQVNVNLLVTGEGTTPQQKAVTRITADQLLDLRLGYLDPPASDFNPPDHCAWKDEDRLKEIMSSSKSPSKLGDVSHEPRKGAIKETAPPLEECKPLEVNEETRWKSRIFKEGDEAHPEEGSDEEVLRKALLILNKLSLTKFEKLSDEFVDTGIGRNAECLNGAVGIIVDKAQSEPHFATMYAQLCLKLSRIPMPEEAGGRKAFKKMLLSRCQQEFEENINKKVEKAIEGVDDTEEKEYKAGLVKKKYLGHMRFIGELYKGDLIRLDVMLFCLKTLLEAYEEEKVECFAKLMTTIGYPLEQQSAILAQSGKPEAQNDLDSCWASVREMSASSETSIRIKFMLQDLTEMKEKGMVLIVLVVYAE
jgi:translation initiation factor 4G